MNENVQDIKNARALEEELRERNLELAALNDLAMAIASSLELDETLRIAVERTFEMVGVTRGGIALVDRDSGDLTAGIAVGLPEDALTSGLAAICKKRGAPLILHDVTGHEDIPVGYGEVGSAALVPLKSGGRTVGVLTVLDEKPRRFSQHDVSLLSAVANLIGPPVENAALFAELSDKFIEVTTLNAIVHSISKRLELSAILDSCLSEIQTVIPFERASIILIEDEGNMEGVIAAVAGSVKEPEPGTVVSIEGTIFHEALSRKKSIVINDIKELQDPVGARLYQEGIRHWVVIPILDEDRAIGTLNIASSGDNVYNPRQVSMLEGIAGHLSVAVANARLYESISRRTLELEALARETQHRVQNNLQMIAGLVGMISNDPEVPPRSVSRCLSQIQAISVIHEMLSSEQDIGEVGIRDTLDRIARMAALAASGGKNVSVEVVGENVRLPSKYANAVGIAVNELVTNAIEHGFAGRDQGKIRIDIRHSNEKTEILVQDDGVGLPEHFSLEKTGGSGLGVLNMLLRQGLGGTLKLETRAGTLARISIKS